MRSTAVAVSFNYMVAEVIGSVASEIKRLTICRYYAVVKSPPGAFV